MLVRQKSLRSRSGRLGKDSLRQAPSASVRTLTIPTMVMASSRVPTPRGRPNWALLARRSSLAESAGSLAIRSRTWATEASSSFRVWINAWATSDIDGNLMLAKNDSRLAMDSPEMGATQSVTIYPNPTGCLSNWPDAQIYFLPLQVEREPHAICRSSEQCRNLRHP